MINKKLNIKIVKLEISQQSYSIILRGGGSDIKIMSAAKIFCSFPGRWLHMKRRFCSKAVTNWNEMFSGWQLGPFNHLYGLTCVRTRSFISADV